MYNVILFKVCLSQYLTWCSWVSVGVSWDEVRKLPHREGSQLGGDKVHLLSASLLDAVLPASFISIN